MDLCLFQMRTTTNASSHPDEVKFVTQYLAAINKLLQTAKAYAGPAVNGYGQD